MWLEAATVSTLWRSSTRKPVQKPCQEMHERALLCGQIYTCGPIRAQVQSVLSLLWGSLTWRDFYRDNCGHNPAGTRATGPLGLIGSCDGESNPSTGRTCRFSGAITKRLPYHRRVAW